MLNRSGDTLHLVPSLVSIRLCAWYKSIIASGYQPGFGRVRTKKNTRTRVADTCIPIRTLAATLKRYATDERIVPPWRVNESRCVMFRTATAAALLLLSAHPAAFQPRPELRYASLLSASLYSRFIENLGETRVNSFLIESPRS